MNSHQLPKRLSRKIENRTGAMLPMIALTMVILIVGLVFSIDIAYMHMVRAELRTATDAAARAGAETLARTQDEGQAIEAAIQIAALNRVSSAPLELTPDQIVLGTTVAGDDGSLVFSPGEQPFTAVRVVGDRSDGSAQGAVPLFFGSLLGRSNFEPILAATASSSVLDIALVLDRSGSMRTEEAGITRIEALQAAVAVFLEEIQSSSPNSNVSLTTYSTNSTRDLPLTDQLDQVGNQVAELPAQGFTNIFQALQQGSDSLLEDPLTRPHAKKVIILMTDGNFNVGGTPIPSAESAAAEGQTIHTITFSSGANQEIMMQCAEIGGGIHLHADGAGDLADAFREIARSLSVTLVE